MKLKLSTTAHASTHLLFYAKNDTLSIPDFKGDKNETVVVYDTATAPIVTRIYCGLGGSASVSSGAIRSAAARGVGKALELKRSEISLVTTGSADMALAALEGALLGAYTFSKYKSEKEPALGSIELVGDSVSMPQAQRVLWLCESVNYARDLVNDNAHVVYPDSFAREASAVAKKGRFKCTVLDEKEIDKKGMGLLKAVGQGSAYPPRLVIMEYRGNPKSRDTTAIVGKGITFDSGGQNLKPTGSIETMRCDMAGAAAVLGVMKVLSKYKPAINVIGICSLAHNALGRNAYFPGDVYTAYNGKTVEINNTDAEGRLVLADAIAYCRDRFKPARIIDLATLTGGIISALGTTIAGLFSNNKALSDGLFNSGERVGERLWTFPLYEEFTESLKSDIADLRNVSKKKKGWASSITGAAFIREFVGDTAWAHIDIAGTAFNEDGGDETHLGATGFGVRLLVDYLVRG